MIQAQDPRGARLAIRALDTPDAEGEVLNIGASDPTTIVRLAGKPDPEGYLKAAAALGRDIRRGFVPQKGWLLLAADYSQIELRLLAHLSHDQAFVQAFQSGGDIHRQTAALIFGDSPCPRRPRPLDGLIQAAAAAQSGTYG